MWLTCSRSLVDRFKAHLGHQPAHLVATGDNPVPAQVGCDLAAAEERLLGEDPVDGLHQAQGGRTDPDRHVVRRRPAQLHQFALLADTQIRMVPAGHRLFIGRGSFLEPQRQKRLSRRTAFRSWRATPLPLLPSVPRICRYWQIHWPCPRKSNVSTTSPGSDAPNNWPRSPGSSCSRAKP